MKRSIIGDDLNLTYGDWKGNVDGTGRGQTFINTLVWENGYTQVVNSAT
jgi:hypothetical protein